MHFFTSDLTLEVDQDLALGPDHVPGPDHAPGLPVQGPSQAPGHAAALIPGESPYMEE